MYQYQLNKPIAFFIFNRPETTEKVFNVIREAKPKQLFIIADGPRENKMGENNLCLQTRNITERIDWECEIKRNYSDVNLGCKVRVSSGIDWVFSNVEEAIFLEDDCLPDPSFFRYCEELLNLYKDDETIMLISGNKILTDYKANKYSYYFSNFNHIWGWASWKRAWLNYDVNISDWHQIDKIKFLKNIFHNKKAIKYWIYIFEDLYAGKINTWDYQLQYLSWKKNGLTIIPAENLVLNIGLNNLNATHTTTSNNIYDRMKLKSIEFPLKHPDKIEVNFEADEIESSLLHNPGIRRIIKHYLRKLKIIE
jgi:hypothetical protein